MLTILEKERDIDYLVSIKILLQGGEDDMRLNVFHQHDFVGIHLQVAVSQLYLAYKADTFNIAIQC